MVGARSGIGDEAVCSTQPIADLSDAGGRAGAGYVVKMRVGLESLFGAGISISVWNEDGSPKLICHVADLPRCTRAVIGWRGRNVRYYYLA